MGFFNFREKKNDEPKKKSDSVKKQIMQALSPKAAGANYFANPKKKKSNRHPKKKSMNKKQH
tara:strand:- start:1895 stop:2080 length:186 start_codon:yes stop_codon:yes gene_type:complete